MKKIYVGVLLASMLGQPVLGMKEGNNGINTNSVSPFHEARYRELLQALRNNDVSRIERLIKNGLDVKVADRDGWTILHAISCDNNTGAEALALLLSCQDIDVNALEYKKRHTPLHTACFHLNKEVIKQLMCHKDIQGVNAQDKEEMTPLYVSCLQGAADVVKLLISHPDIDVNVQSDSCRAPLYWSCQEGHIDIVKMLLACKGIKVSVVDKTGKTPLYAACTQGHTQIVKLLLKHFVMPNVSWQQARLLFIGQMKESERCCGFAALPMEMIHYTVKYLSDNKKTIEALKSFICHEDTYGFSAFYWAKKNIKKELGHILDPQAWQDDQIAEKTYDALVKLLKEDEEKQLQQNGKEEQE